MTDQTKALKLAQEPVATTAANHVAGEIGYCKFHEAVPSGTKLYTSPPAQYKPLTDEQQIAEALRIQGLTLVKTASGYKVLKLGQITAQDITGEQK